MKFLRKLLTSKASQLSPRPEREQTGNAAGGNVYALDPWERIDRFLIFGSGDGTSGVGELAFMREHAVHLADMVREDGIGVVRRIVKISESGRASKLAPAIFALAMCASLGDEATRRLALGRGVHVVCRTGSQLLEFAEYVEQSQSWAGRYAASA